MNNFEVNFLSKKIISKLTLVESESAQPSISGSVPSDP